MGTKLGYMSLLLEVHWSEIAQSRVPARGIVEAFDVIEHVLPCLIARAAGFARDPFSLQRGEEALHRRVVPDVAGPAHRAGDAIVAHQSLELLAGILAPLLSLSVIRKATFGVTAALCSSRAAANVGFVGVRMAYDAQPTFRRGA